MISYGFLHSDLIGFNSYVDSMCIRSFVYTFACIPNFCVQDHQNELSKSALNLIVNTVIAFLFKF